MYDLQRRLRLKHLRRRDAPALWRQNLALISVWRVRCHQRAVRINDAIFQLKGAIAQRGKLTPYGVPLNDKNRPSGPLAAIPREVLLNDYALRPALDGRDVDILDIETGDDDVFGVGSATLTDVLGFKPHYVQFADIVFEAADFWRCIEDGALRMLKSTDPDDPEPAEAARFALPAPIGMEPVEEDLEDARAWLDSPDRNHRRWPTDLVIIAFAAQSEAQFVRWLGFGKGLLCTWARSLMTDIPDAAIMAETGAHVQRWHDAPVRMLDQLKAGALAVEGRKPDGTVAWISWKDWNDLELVLRPGRTPIGAALAQAHGRANRVDIGAEPYAARLLDPDAPLWTRLRFHRQQVVSLAWGPLRADVHGGSDPAERIEPHPLTTWTDFRDPMPDATVRPRDPRRSDDAPRVKWPVDLAKVILARPDVARDHPPESYATENLGMLTKRLNVERKKLEKGGEHLPVSKKPFLRDVVARAVKRKQPGPSKKGTRR
jgi:hypothetical protein